ncbi:hypothetical protein K505DRAFT_332568 [Melanomma pulvis-pyrius CBS 109.77]|uniref:F-box domain-containing protein n=1 Tax=Melanomma pulvis-pyrius CBS 109.77 TaxID=1314802 RepID=A0A6A6XSK7_9PLEO|nr:hypothetical protein K505DRAFT_332568 [Melanomma pulvis-pyrius CBS 109.77]
MRSVPFVACVLSKSSGQSPNGVLPWIQKIRAVRSTRGASSPFLTGVGFLNDRPELIAHPDEAHRYSDSTEGLETHPLRYKSNQFWVFPFHDACWSLLLARVANGEDHSKTQVASHLFNILYCTPRDRFSIFTPGHDYDVVAQFQRPSRNLFQSINTSRIWSYLTADPREILEIDKSLDLSELSSQMIFLAVSKLGPPSTTDVLSRLPVEVITTIFDQSPISGCL